MFPFFKGKITCTWSTPQIPPTSILLLKGPTSNAAGDFFWGGPVCPSLQMQKRHVGNRLESAFTYQQCSEKEIIIVCNLKFATVDGKIRYHSYWIVATFRPSQLNNFFYHQHLLWNVYQTSLFQLVKTWWYGQRRLKWLLKKSNHSWTSS